MSTKSDSQLLREYAGSRSEAAFAELVRRHIDLVHSAALRITNDVHLAKDVSQGVFVAMAKAAGKLVAHPVLSGWLHATTRNIAAQTIRTEARRRKREQQAAAMNDAAEPHAAWDGIAPHLDAALSELADADRDAVLLRYFKNQSAKDMAAVLGISAEAAQKRVNRGVERLREKLAKRGVTAGTAGLAGVISANAVQAAPAGLAALASSAAIVATSSATAVATTKIIAMTTLQKALVAAVVTALAGTAIYQLQRHAKSTDDVQSQSSQPPSGRKQRVSRSVVEQLAEVRSDKPLIDRKKELERLKARWLEVGGGNDTLPEQRALAKEAAQLLLCSHEMLDLLKFLKLHDMGWSEMVTEIEVREVFETSRAAEARQLLTELPETAEITGPRSYKQGGESYRDNWSMAAGKTCPDDEFETFRAALNCKSCAIEALYGHNQRLMASDPQAAFSSSLEAFKSGVPSISGEAGVGLLFDVENCPKFDFQKFEEQLPPDGPRKESLLPHESENGFTLIRRGLFWKWAKIDPAAAANHVMANPDRLDPRLMEEVVGGYSQAKESSHIIAWVATFPEGPYFDAAAKSAACYARGAPGIDELVGKIQDPKIREEAMERAKVPLCNPNTR